MQVVKYSAAHVAAELWQRTHLADVGDIRSLAHKGGSNEVNVVGQTPLDKILLILLCQCRQIYNDAW